MSSTIFLTFLDNYYIVKNYNFDFVNLPAPIRVPQFKIKQKTTERHSCPYEATDLFR